jgi:hypothetical protein
MRGCGWRRALGFDRTGGEGGEVGRNKEEKNKKNFSSRVARLGEKEEETVLLKAALFCFLFFIS